jgi:hypothetical protein
VLPNSQYALPCHGNFFLSKSPGVCSQLTSCLLFPPRRLLNIQAYRKDCLPQNQWAQFAWHGKVKESWQTEQQSLSGGASICDR